MMQYTMCSKTWINYAAKQVEAGLSIERIARKCGVFENTVYRWLRKYDGLSPCELKRLKELERENSQPKKLVAELSLDKQILQDVLQRKLWSLHASGNCSLSFERATRSPSAGHAGVESSLTSSHQDGRWTMDSSRASTASSGTSA